MEVVKLKKYLDEPISPLIDTFPEGHTANCEQQLAEEVEVIPAPASADSSMIIAGVLALLRSCNRGLDDLPVLERHLGVELNVLVSNIYKVMLAEAQHCAKTR